MGGAIPLITAPRRSGRHGRSCGNTPTVPRSRRRRRSTPGSTTTSCGANPPRGGVHDTIFLSRGVRVSRTHPRWGRSWRRMCVASNRFYPLLKNPLSSPSNIPWAGVSSRWRTMHTINPAGHPNQAGLPPRSVAAQRNPLPLRLGRRHLSGVQIVARAGTDGGAAGAVFNYTLGVLCRASSSLCKRRLLRAKEDCEREIASSTSAIVS
jgi:hypothetical protein